MWTSLLVVMEWAHSTSKSLLRAMGSQQIGATMSAAATSKQCGRCCQASLLGAQSSTARFSTVAMHTWLSTTVLSAETRCGPTTRLVMARTGWDCSSCCFETTSWRGAAGSPPAGRNSSQGHVEFALETEKPPPHMEGFVGSDRCRLPLTVSNKRSTLSAILHCRVQWCEQHLLRSRLLMAPRREIRTFASGATSSQLLMASLAGIAPKAAETLHRLPPVRAKQSTLCARGAIAYPHLMVNLGFAPRLVGMHIVRQRQLSSANGAA
mmetsp:Transcript_38150/g.69482  ORF Transcript_38150/g.69482 Transcript_38150/m.69482 type:complete len:266 (-) Transcript_38150:105-902(-)